MPLCFNPRITEQKTVLLLWNWLHFVPIFLKLLSQFFFMIQLIDSVEVKKVLLFRFFSFHAIIWSDIDKIFEDKQISLEFKC
jgi:hypothetical protein